MVCIDFSEVEEMKRQAKLWGIIGFLGIFILILDSKTALTGAREGLELCIRTLVPSLLPFFICSAFMTKAFSGTSIPLLRPLAVWFRIPRGYEYLLINAFLGGYPVGAKSIASAYSQGSIAKEEAERMLTYCSNAGPSFLFGICAQAFSDRKVLWLLWGIHILGAWLVSRCFPVKTKCSGKTISHDFNVHQAVSSAAKAMGMVSCWVIVFRVMLQFLEKWMLWWFPGWVQVLLTGLVELSNGCCALTCVENSQLRFVICSVILAFGGLCVTMQTVSVIEGLSPAPYIWGKLMHCVFSMSLSVIYVTAQWKLLVLIGGILYGSFTIRKKLSRNLRKAIV